MVNVQFFNMKFSEVANITVVYFYLGQGPYTETIDLCFEPFFGKEIMR